MKIYKYSFPSSSFKHEIYMPLEAEILSFQVQHEVLTIWALVDPEKGSVPRYFSIFGTGDYVDKSNVKQYIGTVQVMGGSLVWHLFEMFQ